VIRPAPSADPTTGTTLHDSDEKFLAAFIERIVGDDVDVDGFLRMNADIAGQRRRRALARLDSVKKELDATWEQIRRDELRRVEQLGEEIESAIAAQDRTQELLNWFEEDAKDTRSILQRLGDAIEARRKAWVTQATARAEQAAREIQRTNVRLEREELERRGVVRGRKQ
jgi:hypothetical protein